jgi:hypothetical protein
MEVLPSTGASRYHNCCIDGGISPEYFGYTIVHTTAGFEAVENEIFSCWWDSNTSISVAHSVA